MQAIQESFNDFFRDLYIETRPVRVIEGGQVFRMVITIIIVIININIIIVDIIIIIITRPKPAYGRQGLAGSWGQDTDEVNTFLVFLTSHFARACGAQLGFNQPGTINHGKRPKTMKPP